MGRTFYSLNGCDVCDAGPYKINGVPLRRVNQSYVIATSTKVNIEGLELPAIDDAYFAKEKSTKKSKEEQFFAESNAVSYSFALLVPVVSIPYALACVLKLLYTIHHAEQSGVWSWENEIDESFGISLVLVAALLLRGGSGRSANVFNIALLAPHERLGSLASAHKLLVRH